MKHYEQLHWRCEIRSNRQQRKKKEYRHAKACKQNYTYDWANFIQSETLRKLAVKELNKYTECHNLHGVYIRINEKAI